METEQDLYKYTLYDKNDNIEMMRYDYNMAVQELWNHSKKYCDENGLLILDLCTIVDFQHFIISNSSGPPIHW